MINPKTPQEIIIMREGGEKLAHVREQLLGEAVSGVSLLQLEKLADELIQRAGGTASFKTVEGYRWATCLCINEEVVHSIPTKYRLKDGDILTIDVGMLYRGFHTDTAWTIEIGHREHHPDKRGDCNEIQRFLETGETALRHAIAQAKIGNRIGHISAAIQQTIEPAGYGIVRTLVGHGVGRELHEEPQIPGIVRGTIERTQELAEGTTLAIEVIYAQGNGAIEYGNKDGWTLVTVDRSLSAVFEHTVAVTRDGPVILTLEERKEPRELGLTA